jgi:Na+/H+-dicarboxylate symporter
VQYFVAVSHCFSSFGYLIDCAAPVPSSALVLIITAYNTVFNSTGTPAGFEYIVAIDWFMDRLITVLNVTGDCVVSAVVAGLTPLEEFEDPTKHIAVEGEGSSNKSSTNEEVEA